MKKFFITLTILFAAALGANAQFSIGAGYLNRTNNISFEGTSNSYTLNGFYAGLDAGYNIGYGVRIAPGIYYSYITGRTIIPGGRDEGSYYRHELTFPINVRYSLEVSESLDVFAYAGPQFIIGLASSNAMSGKGNSHSGNNFSGSEGEKHFNAGLGVGLGVDIAKSMRINVGYTIGMLNTVRSENISSKINTLQVGLALLF